MLTVQLDEAAVGSDPEHLCTLEASPTHSCQSGCYSSTYGLLAS